MNDRNQQHQHQQEQKPALASSKAWVGQGGPLFTLGRLMATPAALELLAKVPCGEMALVTRHVRGDFGNLCDEDREANLLAIEHGTRVFSSYELKGGKVWVITEADRSATTVLLPSDY